MDHLLNESFLNSLLFIGQGTVITLQLLGGGLLIGIILGTLIAILRHNNIVKPLLDFFVSILRGTPLLLQLSLVFFTAPLLLGFKLSVIQSGILTFGLNSASYVAEILRAGIESLPKGQFEAAKVLKIPSFYLWKDIILPQVIRNTLPAMVNEIVTLLKETSLIATIGGLDIMRRSQLVAAEQFTYFAPLCIAAAYYYVLVKLVESVGRKLEQRSHYAYAESC